MFERYTADVSKKKFMETSLHMLKKSGSVKKAILCKSDRKAMPTDFNISVLTDTSDNSNIQLISHIYQ